MNFNFTYGSSPRFVGRGIFGGPSVMQRLREAGAVAGGIVLLAAVLALVAVDDGRRGELLAGPVPNIHIPTAATVVRSAMPASWLSRGDERSSPLLQDSSDNALQVMGTPGAHAAPTPARGISLAERTSAPTPTDTAAEQQAAQPQAAQTAVTAPAAAPVSAALPMAPAAAPVSAALPSAGGSASKLASEANALSGQLSALPKVPAISTGSKGAAPKVAPKKEPARGHSPWPKAPTGDRWKSMVKSAEEAADKLAKEHPRSVLGSHWRSALAAPTETLTEDSAAAARAGKAAAQQQVRLAEDNLKQKGIYAPAAMCKKDHLPCPGKLQVRETSTGHYAPVRDNGPAPGQAAAKAASDGGKRSMPAPARYPGVSFYAKMREELSSAEDKARLSSGRTHRTSLEMLGPGEHVRRPSREVEEHRRAEERRDDEKRREEDELRRDSRREGQRSEARTHRLAPRDMEEGEGVRRRDLGRSINDHLYKLFSARSGHASRDGGYGQEALPAERDVRSRDSIRSVEGSKLYQEEMGADDDDDERESGAEEESGRRFPPSEYPPRTYPREAERRAAEEKERRREEGERRIKEAQERMAARWRQMMAEPPRRTRATRPDMLDPRELLVPRTGFEAKKKELHAFKNAIEMYEADPEMNPITIVQAHKLEKYGIMPPESDRPRMWQAWYRMVTDKAQILSDQVAMLAKPLIDARHRWDHGGPGDWCGTGGCSTMSHEQRGDRYVAPPPPAPDSLERSITNKMAKEVVSGEDMGGREPTEVTVSEAPESEPAEYRDERRVGRDLPSLRARDREYVDSGPDDDSENWGRGDIGERRARREDPYRRDDGRAYGAEGWDERRQREGAYQEREPEPVKRLYGKVDQLQDEVSHLVKILSRRQRRQGQREGGRDVRGNEARDDLHATGARLEAQHVVDWLRGATRAAKL